MAHYVIQFIINNSVINVSKQSIIGSTLITADGMSLIWSAKDLSGKRKKWPEVVRMTKELFNKIESNGINVNGVVTDSASEYAAARYKFSLNYVF